MMMTNALSLLLIMQSSVMMTASFIMPHQTKASAVVSSTKTRFYSSSSTQQGEVEGSKDIVSSDDTVNDGEEEGFNAAEEAIIKSLKDELFSLSKLTKRGFDATRSQQQLARDLVNKLAKFNPTDEPASAYYAPKDTTSSNDEEDVVSVPVYGIPTLEGKWTLVYTDGPDITNLDPLDGRGATKLGRIGQECTPPFIKNVIEWTKPDWVKSLPDPLKLGGDDERVLQKVCCEGVATPDHPRVVDLKIVGLDLLGFAATTTTSDVVEKTEEEQGDKQDDSNVVTRLREEGNKLKEEGVAGYIDEKVGPLELRGPLKAPFGRFEILYLDDELRIIRTSQGNIAINKRCEIGVDDWF